MSDSPKQLPKHHYIPVFYLKEWASPIDGRVTAFRRPFGDQVSADRKSPKHTGYDRGLYWLDSAPDRESANLIETLVMGPVDHNAAIAHQFIMRDDIKGIPAAIREAWSRFLVGLLLRSPANINDVYERMMNPSPKERDEIREITEGALLPEDFSAEATKRMALRVIVDMIRGTGVEEVINKMRWSIYNLASSKLEFLTSDRPVIMANGIGRLGGHLATPLSPRKLFLAFADEATQRDFKRRTAEDIVNTVNNRVVRRAIQLAWSTSAKPLRYMQKNLSAEAADDQNFYAGLE
ncbi:DUF4238 domain-containing protein [Bradyrhizobium sp. NC92]|uniref:DUF4238 domain-containing protein n=1 Tax=Bradyrhizobium sp. (strain NC92) TaxID=55395 RepID=UPI0021A9A60C|nr:DUF4238 domain-containing protein [Bradyrhizobium sp. NC92]UWU66112.1 DUF4238 domain-containing protein [Bradyrhizobium sp. NC92]